MDADIPSSDQNPVLAQAKFLRGFCYFYLVTTFGAVPLHTTFNTSASAADAPAPLADLYAQIIKDFTESAADLPNTPAAGTGKPASKATALYLAVENLSVERMVYCRTSQLISNRHIHIAKGIIDNKATYGLKPSSLFLEQSSGKDRNIVQKF